MTESISVSTGKVLLVSVNSKKSATIYDISQSDIILNEKIHIGIESKTIFSSDEFIYFFEGNSYSKFSMVNQKLEKKGNIILNYEKIEYFNLFKSNVDDGNPYYSSVVVENDNRKLIIGQFSMSSMSINGMEPILTIDDFTDNLRLVFTFGGKIYIVTSSCIIHCYCLESNIIVNNFYCLEKSFKAICTDGRGIIYYLCYIYRKLYFQKINIITSEVIQLEFPDPSYDVYFDKVFTMLFDSNRIFLLGNKSLMYDTQLFTWKAFNEDDYFRGSNSGAVIMEF